MGIIVNHYKEGPDMDEPFPLEGMNLARGQGRDGCCHLNHLGVSKNRGT